MLFQSALRFAVVSDVVELLTSLSPAMVSIRFEVRGGFRRLYHRSSDDDVFQSALRFAVVSDGVEYMRVNGEGFNPL